MGVVFGSTFKTCIFFLFSSLPVRFTTPNFITFFFAGVVLLMLLTVAFFKLLKFVYKCVLFQILLFFCLICNVYNCRSGFQLLVVTQLPFSLFVTLKVLCVSFNIFSLFVSKASHTFLLYMFGITVIVLG